MSADGFGRSFPRLAAGLPRLSLAELPTPLEDAPALAECLGVPAIAVKRDDLTSGLYGGNKVRKLEYLLADALARGCDAVVTFGAAGSNHALATAVFAARLGLRCHTVLTPQPATPVVAAKLRWLLRLGTQVHAARGLHHASEIAARIRAGHPGGERQVCEIPWGGSNWLGATAFVAAAFELADQAQAAPDFLYVSGGTMGTAMGLALGLRAAGLPTRVVAPQAVAPGPGALARTAALFGATATELHARDASFPRLEAPAANLELRPEFFGTGYAEPTPAAAEAEELMRTTLGLTLETTYTGKALAGLIADARAGRLARARVVFWNTYSSAPFPPDLDAVDLAGLPDELRIHLAAQAPAQDEATTPRPLTRR